MATKNFVVQNGLTVGPLTIDAATGSITSPGNINITGNLGVTQISKADSSISINDTGGYSNVLITVDGSLKANVNPGGFDITNGNISLNGNWLNGGGGINNTGNILAKSGTLGNLTMNGNVDVTGAWIQAGTVNSRGNVLATNGTLANLTMNGNVDLTGAWLLASTINSKANISAALYTGGTVAVTGNIIAGLAQFAALNSTPIGNATASTGSFTTVNASGNIGVTGAWILAGTINTTGNVSASSHTGGTVAVTGNIIAGLAQFAALNSTPIGNATASTGSFTTIGASGNIGVTGAWINAGTVNVTGNILAAAGTYSTLTFPAGGIVISSIEDAIFMSGTDANITMRGITTEPVAPSAGNLAIYTKSIGGRMMLKQKGPSGIDTPIQTSIAQNKIAYWTALGGTTGNTVVGMNSPIQFGTATGRTVATTNGFTRMRRLGYLSSATAGSIGGHLESNVAAQSQYTIGNGSGLGGFYYICRFGISDAVLVSGSITFVGLTSSTALVAPTTAPSTFTNSIGIGHGSGETNYSIYYGGSAAQTPISLGASFPTNTVSTDMIELILFAPTNVSNEVRYRVLNLNTNAETSGTLTGVAGTVLPASTTFLSHRAYRSNNATATAVALDMVSVYIETDY